MFFETSSTIAVGSILFLTVNYIASLRLALSLKTIFLCGLALRLSFLILPAFLSTDIYRYLWEGHLLRHGVNPYRFAPADSALLSLHTAFWPNIDHKHLTAIYPPLAQLLFWATAHSETTWRGFLVLADSCNFFLLLKAVRAKRLPDSQVKLYWLLPLPIIEIAWSGHLEAIFLTPLLLLWNWHDKTATAGRLIRPFVASMLLATATLIKYNAVFLAPFFACHFLRRTGIWQAFFFCSFYAGLTLIGLAPFLDREFSLFHSLLVYLQHWRYNDSLFHLCGYLAQVNWGHAPSFQSSKQALLLLWAVVAGLASIRIKSFPVLATIVFASFLAISPVVHPWYLLWFAPFLVYARSRAALLICLLAPLSYWPLFTAATTLPVIIKLIEYVPVYLLFLWEWRYHLRTNER